MEEGEREREFFCEGGFGLVWLFLSDFILYCCCCDRSWGWKVR